MIYVDEGKCAGCGTCVEECPRGALVLVGGLATIDQASCDDCGRCLEVCPQGAIYGVTEPLPAVAAPRSVRPAVHPALPAVEPSLVSRVASSLAPVALDLALGLVDRWLSRRPSGGVTTRATPSQEGRQLLGSGFGGMRRRTRRGRRWLG